jgi:CRP/FNR family transcriptional regulator, dissimilatory nitrate respiration regulator
MCLLTPHDWTLIKANPLFAGMEPADIDSLINVNAVLRVPRQQALFARGDPARALFLILEGQIKLSRLSPQGDEAVVHVFRAGESFAEAAMLMGGRYPVDATAIEDSRLIAVSIERLKDRVMIKPEIAFAMLGSMAQHLHSLVSQIEQLKLMTARQRMIRFLLDEAQADSGMSRIALPHDKGLIANRLGMKPETFSRLLSQLVAHGVEVDGGIVTVRDLAHLADQLEQET